LREKRKQTGQETKVHKGQPLSKKERDEKERERRRVRVVKRKSGPPRKRAHQTPVYSSAILTEENLKVSKRVLIDNINHRGGLWEPGIKRKSPGGGRQSRSKPTTDTNLDIENQKGNQGGRN